MTDLSAAASDDAWPPTDWLPSAVWPQPSGGAYVEWSESAANWPGYPFYVSPTSQPSGWLWRTELESFVDATRPSAPPTGFIFHMSRCGSTLAARMLATRPGDVIVSEPPTLDDMVQLAAPSEDEHARRMVAMVTAFGRRRAADGRFIIKLDSWHTLALPLFRRAFPTTPWVFLYREPSRVVASHMREPGMHTAPGMMPAGLFACETSPPAPREDYAARVLAEVCTAVLDHLPLGGGRLVNYDALPDAVWSEILPHFGHAVSAEEQDAMRRAAEVDAKAPHQGVRATRQRGGH